MNIQKSVKIGIVIFNQQLQRSEIALQAQKVFINKRSGKKSVNEKHKVVVYIWNIDWRLLEIDKRRCHFIQPLLICNILPFAIKCQQFFQVIPLTFIKCSNSCSVTIILYNPKEKFFRLSLSQIFTFGFVSLAQLFLFLYRPSQVVELISRLSMPALKSISHIIPRKLISKIPILFFSSVIKSSVLIWTNPSIEIPSFTDWGFFFIQRKISIR